MRSMGINRLVVAIGLTVAATTAAQALSVEFVYGPGTVESVDDNSSLDQDPATGRIEIQGTFGGYELLAKFDAALGASGAVLNSNVGLEAVVANPDEIFFQAWQTDFAFFPPGVTPGAPIGLPAVTTINGGASGLVQLITNVDRSNTGRESVLVYPDQVVAFETYGTAAPELFSDVINRSFSHTAGTPFSLRTGLLFDLDGLGETSFAVVRNQVVPLPAPFVLLGAGLGALGLVGRLRRRRQS